MNRPTSARLILNSSRKNGAKGPKHSITNEALVCRKNNKTNIARRDTEGTVFLITPSVNFLIAFISSLFPRKGDCPLIASYCIDAVPLEKLSDRLIALLIRP